MGVECECCSRKGEFEQIQNSKDKIINNNENKKGTIQNNNYYTNINLNYISSQEKNDISDLLQNNYSVAYTKNKGKHYDLISSSHSLNIKEGNKTFSEILNNQNFNHNFTKGKKSSLLESLRNSMLNEINNSRYNPLNLISKIQKYSQLIHISKKNCFYIKVDEKNKIKLYKGIKLFEQCEIYLKGLNSFPPFLLRNEMTFPFPEIKNKISIKECTNQFYLNKTLKKINENLEKNYNISIINFHYDIMTSNTELSVVLQIVDDTNSNFHRRNNIFRKEGKYIGINVAKISEELFCYYLLFGKDKLEG